MAAERQHLPIGIQSFEKLRTSNKAYVDKTAYVYHLVHNSSSYFLSRPRRFGKSLLLSTLKAYWEGKKDLFAGLALETLEDKAVWESYPVFYIDFNRDNFLGTDSLEQMLDVHLKEWENRYGCEDPHVSCSIRFQNLLRTAYTQTGRRCVILVDEYDKPLLETMENRDLVEYNKAVFKGFFSTLKSFDEYIQFVLITGVTKFNKVSIFSDLNQLQDISFDSDFAAVCGITDAELAKNFMPEISRMAEENSLTLNGCLEKLKKTYDGYHFSSKGEGVYNPFSLLCALNKRRFGSFWYETGTPTFLVKKLREINFDVRQFDSENVQATEAMLSDYRIENTDPVPLLYQTGYLTITGYSGDDIYTLGFPNEEVRYAFLESLMPEYVENCGAGSGKDIFSLKRFIENGSTDEVKNILTALFAGIPYTTDDAPFEHYFQTVLFIVFTLLGKYVHCEIHTTAGRIDCVVETAKYVYIFEFKRDQSAEEALKQIQEKGYALPYASDRRKVFQIGVNFNSATRMPDDWKVVES
ncbi:MAG: ATP-binding protein [Anaerolineaceae bacterium]|nr:ATP-binding protein [Anaerolineaceae bacterium]